MVKRQSSTRASVRPAPINEGSEPLAKQAAVAKVEKEPKAPNSEPRERHDRFAARRDADDTARKRHAKATGGNLFPEVKPQDKQIVLATKASRVGSPQFMAQYRTVSASSPDGAFYSNLNGEYSMLEGTVDSWMELPG